MMRCALEAAKRSIFPMVLIVNIGISSLGIVNRKLIEPIVRNTKPILFFSPGAL